MLPIIVAAANIVIFVFLAKMYTSYISNGVTNGTINTTLLLCAVVVIDIIALLNYTKKDRELRNLKEYNQIKNYVEPLMEKHRREIHDYKNHLSTLYTYANNKDQLSTYIDSLVKELNETNQFLQWDNPIVGALVQNKFDYAKANNISFTAIPVEDDNHCSLVKDYHLVSIISNLIDNAFNAVSNSNPTSREVYFLFNNSKTTAITVKNSFSPNEPIDFSK